MESGAAHERGRGSDVRVGPAGWSYEDWRGVVYPPPGRARFDTLSYIARYFDCVEINSTFYRIPSSGLSASWARRVRGNGRFRFTVKLFRGFTHEIGSAGRKEEDALRRGIEPLAEENRLGCLLVQFPWSFKNVEKNRRYLEGLVGRFPDLPLVLEVRHASWNTPAFYDYLAAGGIGFCNIDQPLFRGSLRPSARSTSTVGYFRLHGRNYDDWFREGAGRDARYDYLYSEGDLEPWARRIEALRGRVSSIYVITNNHFRGQAVCNALQLKARLSGGSVEVPPPLLEAFPQLAGISAPPAGRR